MMARKSPEEHWGTKKIVLVAALSTVSVVAALFLIVHRSLGVKDVSEAVRTSVTFIGVVALAVTGALAYQRQKLGEEQQQDNRSRDDRDSVARLHDRFTAAVAQLGADSVTERLGGAYALASAADEWIGRNNRREAQTCISVLCAYTRSDQPPPSPPTSGANIASSQDRPWDVDVRQTIILLIRDRLLGKQAPWVGYDFDFTGATFNGDYNFSDAQFGSSDSGGTVTFSRANFTGGTVTFDGVTFNGSHVTFDGARFDGGTVTFDGAKFTGAEVNFNRATFDGCTVTFNRATFADGEVDFNGATFDGGTVTFDGGTIAFDDAKFDGGTVAFDRAKFHGGRAIFNMTKFTNSKVSFDSAKFQGGTVSFDTARFNSGAITFEGAGFARGKVSFDFAKFSASTAVDFSYTTGTIDSYPSGPWGDASREVWTSD